MAKACPGEGVDRHRAAQRYVVSGDFAIRRDGLAAGPQPRGQVSTGGGPHNPPIQPAGGGLDSSPKDV